MDSKRQQIEHNEKTSSGWESYASHRQKVSAITIAAAQGVASDGQPSCCILGAGNGNDLDLALISTSFSSIHLFDLDESALKRIKHRYRDQPDVLSRLVVEEPVDVTAIYEKLDTFHSSPSCSLTQLIESASIASMCDNSLSGRTFDVVVSVCLLSQLINAVVYTFRNDENTMNQVLLAVRNGHLNLLSRLSGKSGRTILITDFVSSDTLPQLVDADDDEKLLAAARTAIDSRNFFSGTNPWAIIEKLKTYLSPADHPSLGVSPPWRWQLGPRFFAVTAIAFSKS